MVDLVQRGGTYRNSEPDDLVSSCKHVLWLLQGFVLNISFSVSVIMLGVCQCGRYSISLEENGEGGEAAWHSGCQISAPAPASIPTCISYMLAKWQATNCLLFPFTHVPFLHFCPLRSGVRLQRLLCGDPIGGISLQACAVRWYLTFCLRSLKMCAFYSEYFRLTIRLWYKIEMFCSKRHNQLIWEYDLNQL